MAWMGTLNMIAALIPMKDPILSKQRLSGLLNPEERYGLALAMFHDVIVAVRGASNVDRVVVYGSGGQIAEMARGVGCEFLEDPANEGETQAVARATEILSPHFDGLLVIPADVPLVRSEDVDILVNESRMNPGVTLCPSRDRLGTNGVLRRPGGVMPLTFGSNSFYPHRALAHRLGLPCMIVALPRLGLDIDRPEDVATFLSEAVDNETYRYLLSIGVKERLDEMFLRIEPSPTS